MNKLDKQYQALLQDILDNGVEKKDRTGTGTISVFGRQIRHKMNEGFPLLTTKKMYFKGVVTELIWFLRGDTNIRYLIDNDCHIWDGDAYKNYEKSQKKPKIGDHENYIDCYCGHTTTCDCGPMSKDEFINKIKTDSGFAKKWGELGPIYGRQWRSWNTIKWETTDKIDPLHPDRSMLKWNLDGIDQIRNLINDLKTNPDSRRLMVSAWNVAEIDDMVLPPCHYGFQVYTRELSFHERCKIQIDRLDGMYSSEKDIFIKSSIDEVKLMTMDKNNIPTRAISLMWNQRSVDTFLGLPFNIASYGLLLEIIAKVVNMVPDELIGNLGDTHLYSNHIEQAREQIGRRYTTEERHNMLKESMGDFYQTAVDEQVPFGGGLSEYYVSHNIPLQTREPYPLPTLKHMKMDSFYKELSDDLNLFGHLDKIDFVIENYKSHSKIEAPLSN
jgi:thymidylate synthase